MNKSYRKRLRAHLVSEINVVPYIDVMLVLLVIFLITAPQITPAIIELPSVARAQLQKQAPPLLITIESQNSYHVRYQEDKNVAEQQFNLSDLIHFLHARKKGHEVQFSVVLAAKKGIAYDRVTELMSSLKQENIDKIGLLVTTP